MKQIARLLLYPLKVGWKLAGAPVHTKLFGRYFRATVGRLDSTLGHLNSIRGDLDEVGKGVEEARRELVEISAALTEVRENQTTIEKRLEDITADRWDSAALARRLAPIEDAMFRSTNGTGSSESARSTHE